MIFTLDFITNRKVCECEKLFEATKLMPYRQQKGDNLKFDEPNYHLVHFFA